MSTPYLWVWSFAWWDFSVLSSKEAHSIYPALFNLSLIFYPNQIGSPSIVLLLYLHVKIKESRLERLSEFLPTHKVYQLSSKPLNDCGQLCNININQVCKKKGNRQTENHVDFPRNTYVNDTQAHFICYKICLCFYVFIYVNFSFIRLGEIVRTIGSQYKQLEDHYSRKSIELHFLHVVCLTIHPSAFYMRHFIADP